MKKLLTIVLALIMIFSIAACNPDSGKEYDDSNFISDVTNPQIVKEKITLKLFATTTNLSEDYNSMDFFKWMEDRTNIHIEWVYGDASKRALEWADLQVDGFFMGNDIGEQILYSGLGALVPVSDYYEYTPNYVALMEENADIERTTKLDDGKSYAFARIDNPDNGFNRFYTRTDWISSLKEAGKLSIKGDAPRTVDELTETLTAFKQYQGQYGIPEDIQPVSIQQNNYTVFARVMLTAWGILDTELYVDPVTNEIKFGFYEDDSREFMQWMREAIENDLISKNVTSRPPADSWDEINNGFSGLNIGSVAVTEENRKEIILPPLSLEENGLRYASIPSYITPAAFVITSKCKYPRELARWVDVFYSEEGSLGYNAGFEGEHYEYVDKEEGTWKNIFDPSWEGTLAQKRSILFGKLSPRPTIGTLCYNSLPGENVEDPTSAIQIQEIQQDYVPNQAVRLPVLKFTSDENKRAADLLAQLRPYMLAEFAKFIRGDASQGDPDIYDDADWNAYKAQLKKIGVEELIEIYQDAYDRHVGK